MESERAPDMTKVSPLESIPLAEAAAQKRHLTKSDILSIFNGALAPMPNLDERNGHKIGLSDKEQTTPEAAVARKRD